MAGKGLFEKAVHPKLGLEDLIVSGTLTAALAPKSSRKSSTSRKMAGRECRGVVNLLFGGL